MRHPKYPLEPLSALRDKKVDEAVGVLATATGEHESSNRKRLQSETRRDAHGAAAERVRSAEEKALERGELCAADLAHADAWEHRISEERHALSSEVDRVRVEEAGARAAQERACADLASRKADAQLVAKDRARWQEAIRKREESAEEEAASEAWRPSKP
jgi:hypothetical protein